MKLIPTHIYEINDPEVTNRASRIKKLGFIGILGGLASGIAGLIGLLIGDKMNRENIEDIGD